MVRVQLAGIPIQMSNHFPDLEELCCDYITKEAPLVSLAVSLEEIEKERSLQDEIFTDGYLETVCLYRKLALELLQHNVFVMHASVVEVDGEGYAFLAHSGTGKTTQTNLWLDYFGSRARVVNGDKPLVRAVEVNGNYKFIAYGTPWCGKEGMGCNAFVPLKALFFLDRAEEPTCEAVSHDFSIDRLFHQMLIPEDSGQMLQLLTLVDQLIENIPCYHLQCNMTHDSVKVAYSAVNKGESEK